MKRLFYFLLPFGLSMALSCHQKTSTGATSSSGNSNSHDYIADFESELSQNLAIKKNGSFSAAVVKNDKIIWSKAFGKADLRKNINADTSTIYRIGSISKTITAYLLLLMVQKRVIQLDEPVANYLPEIRSVRQKGADPSGDITFRQLADHTSGLVREPELPYAASGPIETWEDKVLKSIPTTTLNRPAGKTFLYSNIGYAILGLTISRAAHKPFTELVEELIFRPHGMTNSFYSIPRGFEDRIAKGYSWNSISSTYESRQSEEELTGRGYKVPNGGVFTTPNDLARFVLSLMADTDPLARNYRDSMQTIQTPGNNNTGYGLGLQITNKVNGVKMVGHGGLVAGFGSYMVFNPASGIGVIVCRNCDDDPSIEFKANMLLNNLVKANN